MPRRRLDTGRQSVRDPASSPGDPGLDGIETDEIQNATFHLESRATLEPLLFQKTVSSYLEVEVDGDGFVIAHGDIRMTSVRFARHFLAIRAGMILLNLFDSIFEESVEDTVRPCRSSPILLTTT